MQYRVSEFNKEQRVKIIERAKELADNWWVDVLGLDNKVILGGMRRQRIDISFEDIMAKFKKDSHFVIIHREYPGNHIEVGFSTSTNPVYFLWIIVNVKHLQNLIKEFDLKEWG